MSFAHGLRFIFYRLHQVRNFFKWYRTYFHQFVHHHHDIEEQIVIPELKLRFEVPPKISADHKELVAALDGLSLFTICRLYVHVSSEPNLDAHFATRCSDLGAGSAISSCDPKTR